VTRSVLFIQLPLLDHGRFYIAGNVDYAPASLTAYLHRRFRNTVRCESLPDTLANFASNRLIARYIDAVDPEIVAFTCYLWNIERNLEIAREIRERAPRRTILFGGPEIAQGSWALAEPRDAVDAFVTGEGEWFFSRLLGGVDLGPYRTDIRGNAVYAQPAAELLSADEIVEPFTAGYLNTMNDGSIFLELVRGCPYRCAYCNYSKNSATVRELPFDRLVTAIERGRAHELTEIYILAPTFNRSSDFDPLLRRLAAMRHGVRLHTEMRTDGIDTDMAARMYDAGFRSLEVGLQTLSTRALREIGRSSRTDAELAGMTALRDAGIDLKIGIIPGLPGDTPEGFIGTVTRLIEEGFGDQIELYPLLVLPGTRMRDIASNRSARFQSAPPYYFTDGWGFDEGMIRDIVARVRAETGYEYDTIRIPDCLAGAGSGIVGGVHFRGDDPDRWDGARYRDIIDTNVFTITVSLGSPDAIVPGLPRLFSLLPADVLYTLIFVCDLPIPEQPIVDFLTRRESDSFLMRLRIFDEPKRDSRIQCFQVITDPAVYRIAHDTYRVIEPIFRLTMDTMDAIPLVRRCERLGMVLAPGVYEHVARFIITEFSDRPDRIGFESETDMARFYRECGLDLVRVPLTPSVLDR